MRFASNVTFNGVLVNLSTKLISTVVVDVSKMCVQKRKKNVTLVALTTMICGKFEKLKSLKYAQTLLTVLQLVSWFVKKIQPILMGF